jgi:2,5-dihydroxypyridine 5,6-dioxygenase
MVKIGGESTAYYGPTALSGNRPAVEALKAADMVVDLMGIDRGSEQQEILDAGARILLAKEPPEVLMRLVPNDEDKRRVSGAAACLQRAKSLRVTSTLGTDMTAALGEYPLLVQYGLADEAGRWDHWPSAFVATWPNEQSATGTVVLAPGDTILPFKQYVREPIHLTIESGSIRKIEGGFDAEYLREYIESFNDIEGYAVSHLGWGLQKRSRWTALGMYDKRQTNGMEARSFDGNFMFSTGPNAEAGGNRHTPCHLDIPMRNCSIFLDGEAVVEHGKTLAS